MCFDYGLSMKVLASWVCHQSYDCWNLSTYMMFQVSSQGENYAAAVLPPFILNTGEYSVHWRFGDITALPGMFKRTRGNLTYTLHEVRHYCILVPVTRSQNRIHEGLESWRRRRRNSIPEAKR
jgi:hypothetical protein